jgi:CRP/FNR family transcriptional regulator, cyclic AMP receptor protein
MDADPDRLANVPVFAGLTEDERASVASWLVAEDHPRGTRLTHEGRTDYAFFVLDEGTVRVERDGRTIATLEPGAVFGEMAFFGDGVRNADVVAETAVRIMWMFGSRFREMQMTMPDAAARIEELASERQPEA